jgi:uncharacterized RDD family membrane protein YckC
MQTWRIKLESGTGSTVSYQQCAIRFVGAILSASLLGAGYWWVLFDKQGKSWHDHLSNSRLVVLPKRAKKKK